ncbi:hypothetical protein AVEN_57732-1 [Araneus ventricosus]|uniref:Uncharacterized protein n=1 Tax=Araneus ventricosus TaxID=182803 RepID=A0A4Y2KT07_ARAVE|nr:hypothetical protein AVEN_12251-1 [Araneus ventricosus]GBN05322.1 hypothetical protein AVEN_57732-1 [Araneus ventricosus]
MLGYKYVNFFSFTVFDSFLFDTPRALVRKSQEPSKPQWPSGKVSAMGDGGLIFRSLMVLNICRVYGLVHDKSYVGDQTPPAGVMRKFEEQNVS